MKFTRVAAVSIILMSGAMSSLQAQSLGNTAQPAEYPPASFKARQYVDSRGCVFIRAGIDGATRWVPRVNRAREQLCGYKPSNVAGATKAPQASPGVEMITLPTESQPAAPTPAPKIPPAQKKVAQPKPAAPMPPQTKPAGATAATGTPRKAPTTNAPRATAVVPTVKSAPRAKPVVPSPQAPSASGGSGCAGASALSQQYINKTPDVRCGPQAKDPLSHLTPGQQRMPGTSSVNPSFAGVAAEYEEMVLPDGFRAVWDDGRLNPQRGPRSAAVTSGLAFTPQQAPEGFRFISSWDSRFNEVRGIGTPAGDAQMAQVWSNTVPRKAVKPQAQAPGTSTETGLVMRLSTRSEFAAGLGAGAAAGAKAPARVSVMATGTAKPARYVRAGVFSDPTVAKQMAQALARETGLPIRLGAVMRKGQGYKVVLAGPFVQGAETALRRVQSAGYPDARLSK